MDRDRWDGLLRAAVIAACVIALLLVGEVAVFAVYPRPESALAHFELFQRDPLVGLLTLDLLGIVSYVLLVPVILAVYVTTHRSSEAVAAVAVLLFVLGVADFLATNTAFPVLSLSGRYAAAGSESERAAILAAGEAMFTLFNENAFLLSYVIVSASCLLLGVAMLRSDAFSGGPAWSAVLAGGFGIVAVALEHASSSLVSLATPVYFGAIVFLIAWVLLVARTLARVRRELRAGPPGPTHPKNRGCSSART